MPHVTILAAANLHSLKGEYMDLKPPESRETPLDLLVRCDGYYVCPKNEDGVRMGPLVRCTSADGDGRRLVSEEYIDFAKMERHASFLRTLAVRLRVRLINEGHENLLHICTGFCGVPEGGKALAVALAILCRKQYIYPEKNGGAGFKFSRHKPNAGELWWIIEDVCSTFTSAREVAAEIANAGAKTAGLLCFLDRSHNKPRIPLPFPCVPLVRKPIYQYPEDDSYVKKDVAAGNVVRHPKAEWDSLIKAMKAGQ